MTAAIPAWWPTDAATCYDDLVSYRLVGASACADRISDALVGVATASHTRQRDVRADLDHAAALFCRLKPDTALYRNLSAHLAWAARTGRADDVRQAARQLSDYRRDAQEEIVAHTCDELADADTLLVHDYSSMVMRVVARLADQRPRHIVVTAGEPLGQGVRVARQAAAAGHHVTYIPDMSAARIIKRVDCFLTGVECFYRDGSMANTVGTLMLALLCRDADVPVVAPAETLKCDLEHATVLDVDLTASLMHPWPTVRPDASDHWSAVPFVLDAVPASALAYFVTEHGKSRPEDVGETARAARMQRQVDVTCEVQQSHLSSEARRIS